LFPQAAALVEPIVAAKNLDSSVAGDLVSDLLEGKRPVFAPLAECRRPFDVAGKERFPPKIEPVGDCLNALAPHGLPMRHLSLSQLGEVRLKPGFGQCPFKQSIVAPIEGNRMIPDLCRHVDRAVQVPESFAPEKLKLKRLTHRI
jgi:hypothetical protein